MSDGVIRFESLVTSVVVITAGLVGIIYGKKITLNERYLTLSNSVTNFIIFHNFGFYFYGFFREQTLRIGFVFWNLILAMVTAATGLVGTARLAGDLSASSAVFLDGAVADGSAQKPGLGSWILLKNQLGR